MSNDLELNSTCCSQERRVDKKEQDNLVLTKSHLFNNMSTSSMSVVSNNLSDNDNEVIKTPRINKQQTTSQRCKSHTGGRKKKVEKNFLYLRHHYLPYENFSCLEKTPILLHSGVIGEKSAKKFIKISSSPNLKKSLSSAQNLSLFQIKSLNYNNNDNKKSNTSNKNILIDVVDEESLSLSPSPSSSPSSSSSSSTSSFFSSTYYSPKYHRSIAKSSKSKSDLLIENILYLDELNKSKCHADSGGVDDNVYEKNKEKKEDVEDEEEQEETHRLFFTNLHKLLQNYTLLLETNAKTKRQNVDTEREISENISDEFKTASKSLMVCNILVFY
jgi:hypothetical protein